MHNPSKSLKLQIAQILCDLFGIQLSDLLEILPDGISPKPHNIQKIYASNPDNIDIFSNVQKYLQ